MELRGSRVEVAKSLHGWVVTGEIDAWTCRTLVEAFAELPDTDDRPIELDLAGVSFIDSSGLHVLLELAERVTATGGSVVIRNPARAVQRLLAITRLEAMFGLNGTDPPAGPWPATAPNALRRRHNDGTATYARRAFIVPIAHLSPPAAP